MKIIHTADWHLGDTFHGFDRSDEHEYFLKWLLETIRTQEADALLLSGDIFDNPNPSAAAERLFYGFLSEASKENSGLQIIVTSGNHDSSLRLEAPTPLLDTIGVSVRASLRRNAKGEPDYNALLLPLTERSGSEPQAVVLTLPYLRNDDMDDGETMTQATQRHIQELETAARRKYGPEMPLLLMAHFYAVGSEISEEHSERIVVGGEEAVNCADIGQHVRYAALGHIHKAQAVKSRPQMQYAGSVLPMSFAERGYSHGVNLLTLQGDRLDVERIDYTPLRPLRSIPEDTEADTKALLKELKGLKSGNRTEKADDWPYIEIRVSERQSDTTIVGDIMQALEGRCARLCRIVKVRTNGEVAEAPAQVADVEDIKRLNPAQIARNIYKNVFGEDMPDDIACCFAQAKRRAEAEEAEEQVHVEA